MLEQFTPLETKRAEVRKVTIDSLSAANTLAGAMAYGYSVFWQAEPAEMLEFLNNNVPNNLDLLMSNSELGAIINAKLNDANLPEYSARVPLSMPVGYAFNGTEFTYTAPVIPEPLPEEQP
jgi:hypothetical protein